MNRDYVQTREFDGFRLELVEPETRAEGGQAGPDEVVGRIMPWDTTTQIGTDLYERFERGAFDKTLRENPHAVKLYSTHNTRDKQPIGSIISSENREDGQYVRFSLNRTQDGLDARELWRTRDVTGLSVGFVALPDRTKPIEHPDGTRTLVRQEAILDHVGLVARPAYPDAQVVAMRTEKEKEPKGQPLIESEEVLAAYSDELADEPPPHPNEPEGTPLLDEWQEYVASLD